MVIGATETGVQSAHSPIALRRILVDFARSVDTVMRDWKLAKVWLLRELKGQGR